jgi:hypothetical protein
MLECTTKYVAHRPTTIHQHATNKAKKLVRRKNGLIESIENPDARRQRLTEEPLWVYIQLIGPLQYKSKPSPDIGIQQPHNSNTRQQLDLELQIRIKIESTKP